MDQLQKNGQRITIGKPKYPICPWAAVLDIGTCTANSTARCQHYALCYISDITSTRCVASTSTWRPFYSSHTHTRSRGTLHQRSAVTFRHVNALYLRDTLTSSLAADPHHRALHKRLAGKQLGSLHGLESWEYTREILQWHQMCCMKSRYKTSSLIVRVTFLRIATEIKTTRNAEFSRRS